MTYYYKTVDETGKLIMIGTQSFAPVEGQIALTEEEYNTLLAQIKAHAEAVAEYVEKVRSEEIELSDVPEEYREEVEAIINQPEPPDPEQAEVDELLQEISEISY